MPVQINCILVYSLLSVSANTSCVCVCVCVCVRVRVCAVRHVVESRVYKTADIYVCCYVNPQLFYM